MYYNYKYNEPQPQKPKKKALTIDDMCFISEKFLFPGEQLPEKFRQKFHSYIKNDFKRINCCVLWDRDPDLVGLIAQYNLPPIEKKEVRMSTTSIHGSLNYVTLKFVNLAEQTYSL